MANRGHRPWNPGRAAAPWVKGSWAGTPAAGASPVSSSAEQRPAEERKHPVDGVRQPDRDPVAGADPGLAEPAGHPGGAVPQLRIADPAAADLGQRLGPGRGLDAVAQHVQQ